MNLPPPIGATRAKRPASRWPAALVAALLGGAGGFTVENEGMVFTSYADPAWGWSVPTACAGDTGPHIQPGMTFSADECFSMLDARLQETWPKLARCINKPISLNVALSLLSFADNAGVSAVCNSTMVRLVNAGAEEREFCPQLSRWVYANGKKLTGLVRRREREQAVCLGLRDLAAEKGVDVR